MKKLISIFMVLLIVFSATACSSSSSSKKSSSKLDKGLFTIPPDELKKINEKTSKALAKQSSNNISSESESDYEDYVSKYESDEDDEDSYNQFDEFIFPNSDSVKLTSDDLEGLTESSAKTARNEILARRGVIFTDQSTQNYFESKNWYNGTINKDDFSLDSLNEIEHYNYTLLSLRIKKIEWSSSSSSQKSNSYNKGGGTLCTACGGSGDCTDCAGTGNCQKCNGSAQRVCTFCSGGTCRACGGSGTMYKYIGLDMKKVKCDTCQGKRVCKHCNGSMRIRCDFCSGSGHCYSCKGMKTCIVCFGNGYR